MNNLMSKLDRMVDDINNGSRSVSTVSSYLSSITITSIFVEDSQAEDAWRELRRELERVGLSAKILTEQRNFIVKWFTNAIKSGRLESDNLDTRSIGPVVDMQHDEEDIRPPPQDFLQFHHARSTELPEVPQMARPSWLKRLISLLTPG